MARNPSLSSDKTTNMVNGNIIFAAETDDVKSLNGIIDAGGDINFIEELSGITPLHAACARNSVNIVKQLFEFGNVLDTSIRDKSGRTAFEVALEAENFEIVDFMFPKLFPENYQSLDPL